MATMTLTIKRSWWVMPFLFGVQLCSWLTGLEPDIERVGTTLAKGFKVVIQ